MTQRIDLEHDLGRETLEIAFVGPEDRPATLVFLHEGVGSVAAWRGFPASLCGAVSACGLVYSRRGYGHSSPHPGPPGADYLHREARAVLPALLAQLKIAHPLLVGHSDGGSIALLYAAKFPARAVVAMAPHVFVEEVTLAGVQAARAAWDSGKLHAGLAKLHADPHGAFFGWNDAWLAPGFRDWNIEAELPAVRCPVLAIQGHDDQYGTMAQLDRIARGVGGPCELLKLADCGHAPQRDQRAAVITAIAALYRSTTGAATP